MTDEAQAIHFFQFVATELLTDSTGKLGFFFFFLRLSLSVRWHMVIQEDNGIVECMSWKGEDKI